MSPVNNPDGINNHGPVTPQMTQGNVVKPVAPAQTNFRALPVVQQRLGRLLRPAPAPPAQAHLERVRQLRKLASAAPFGLQHIAADMHRQAGLLEGVHLERAAELRRIAASAPPGLADIAAEMHQRADRIEGGDAWVL